MSARTGTRVAHRRRIIIASGAAAALAAGLVTSFAVTSVEAATVSADHSVGTVDDHGRPRPRAQARRPQG